MTIQQKAQHLNKAVGLRQMNTACVGLFPDKTDSIESNPTNPVAQQSIQQLDEANEHLRVVPIQIHLIRAKRGPYLTAPMGTTELRKQGGTPRTNHIVPTRIWTRFQHTRFARLLMSEELLDPGMRCRNVIEHKICHQATSLSQGIEIRPIAILLLNCLITRNSKTTIARGF